MIARPHFQKLVERTRLQPPLVAAVVYPCDRESLQMAMSGAFAGYLAPLLVGPERAPLVGSSVNNDRSLLVEPLYVQAQLTA